MKQKLVLKAILDGEVVIFDSGSLDSFTASSNSKELKLPSKEFDKFKFRFFRKGENWILEHYERAKRKRCAFTDSKPLSFFANRLTLLFIKSKLCHIVDKVIKCHEKEKRVFETYNLKKPGISSNSFIMIGSDSDCDVVLDNPLISKHNTLITTVRGNYFIQDMASNQGTKVNGSFLLPKTKMQIYPYDTIEVAGEVFTILKGQLLRLCGSGALQIDVFDIHKTIFVKRRPMKILDGIVANFKGSTLNAVIGGSGTGKTTFLNLVKGNETFEEGNMFFNCVPKNEFPFALNEKVAYLTYKDKSPKKNLTVFQNLQKCIASFKLKEKLTAIQVDDICTKAIKTAMMEESANKKYMLLDIVDKRKYLLAKAMLFNPQVLLVDEICNGLNKNEDQKLVNLLYNIAKNKKTTVLFSTHNMESVTIADNIIAFGKGGRFCYFGETSKCLSTFGARNYYEILSFLSIVENSVRFQDRFMRSSIANETNQYLANLYSSTIEENYNHL